MVRLAKYADVRSGGLLNSAFATTKWDNTYSWNLDCTAVYHYITIFFKTPTNVVGILQTYMHPHLRTS